MTLCFKIDYCLVIEYTLMLANDLNYNTHKAVTAKYMLTTTFVTL